MHAFDRQTDRQTGGPKDSFLVTRPPAFNAARYKSTERHWTHNCNATVTAYFGIIYL